MDRATWCGGARSGRPTQRAACAPCPASRRETISSPPQSTLRARDLARAPGLIFLGFAPAELQGLGGTFLVNPSPMKIFHVQLGGAPGVPGAGYAWFPTGGDLTSVQGLTVYLQGVFADPAGPTGKTLSNAVSVSIQ